MFTHHPGLDDEKMNQDQNTAHLHAVCLVLHTPAIYNINIYGIVFATENDCELGQMYNLFMRKLLHGSDTFIT